MFAASSPSSYFYFHPATTFGQPTIFNIIFLQQAYCTACNNLAAGLNQSWFFSSELHFAKVVIHNVEVRQ
jgi:hypothetical protein